MKLIKTLIQKIEPPKNKDQAFYRDDQLKGFAVRVTAAGVKSFVLEKLINGKVKRITIGRFGVLSVEQARNEALKLLVMIATGIDPLAKKQADKARAVHLKEVFQTYTKIRKDLKPKTVYDYTKLMETAFGDWLNQPLLNITKDKVMKRHTKLGEERGHGYANLAMRVLRAIFNFAASQYEDSQGLSIITENPVKRLSQTRAWYRINRRQNYIKPHELHGWYEGVMQLTNDTLRDYFLFVLFTGLRRQEAAKLKWSDIDLKDKTLIIRDTKNKEAHTLPLTHYLCDILSRRKEVVFYSQYIFPGTVRHGYIIEPRKQRNKITEYCGVSFTLHDLRRTFITIAESLDISAYAVKRLVNHKMSGDVTAGYIISDVERLRKPMQMITDFIINQTQKEASNII